MRDIYMELLEEVDELKNNNEPLPWRIQNVIINKPPTPDEIEAIVLYLNRDNLPQA